MFGFFSMSNDYESRKVGRHDGDGFFVSTARVTDSKAPFETAVSHPNYNDGDIVIVANYYTKEDAKAGHDRWVKIMTSPVLPEKLRDVGLSLANQMMDEVSDSWRDEIE